MGSFLSSQSQLPPASSSPVAPAATTGTASPQWTPLAPYGGGSGKACNITGDSKTIAAAATSNGHRISVSLRREPFSVMSRICLRFLPGTADRASASSTVIAGARRLSSRADHFDRKLLETPRAFDYFVYSNAGAGDDATADPAARPPSLYLLPAPVPALELSATGLLCRGGEAKFVVAVWRSLGLCGPRTAAAATPIGFELRLFRHGKWCVEPSSGRVSSSRATAV